MSIKPQFFLLGPAVAGLSGPIDRLMDVGYQVVPFDFDKENQTGVAVLAVGRDTDFNVLEQSLLQSRKLNPDMEWIAIFSGRLKVKLHYLYGVGFNQIFQIPLDEELFTNRIFEKVPLDIAQKDLKFDHLLRVNLPLLRDLDRAPFDVFMYLPSNRRIMLYFREGLPIEKSQLEKFDKNKNYALFIRKSNIAKYKEYSAVGLLSIKDNPVLSDDEKIQTIQDNVHLMMGPFFADGEMSDEEGRQTVMQIQGILRGLQIQPSISEETLVSLEKLAAQKMTNASHSNNVAAYCALFGIALGLKNLDELRLGGLLHDVGLADLPVELLGRDEKKMSTEDRARYHLHPGNGKTDVINRKVPVTESVLNMILYHHERPDGSGYPYGKMKADIPIEAQLCSFADEFDKLTSLREGYRCYSAKEALLLLSGQAGEPASVVFNPEVHQKIVNFYLSPSGSALVAADAGAAVVAGDGAVVTGGQAAVEAPARAGNLGEVVLRDRATKVDRKKFKKPILLSDLKAKLPALAPGQLPQVAEIEFEISALEKEVEYYFFEKKS